MATTYHAEHVGSLLRPPYLLQAREAHEKGELTAAQLREVEDRAIVELLDVQKQAGLTVFTDGEARRESWRAGLMESLSGVEPVSRTLRWYRDGKELSPEETLSDGVAAVTEVSRKQDLTGVEAGFMAAHAPGTFKITMISASMGGMIWDRERSSAVYPTPNDLIEDLVTLQIDEIGGLAARGVRWIQLDSLSYNQVIDPRATGGTRDAFRPDRVLDAAINVDTLIVTAVKREHRDLTVGMHICRGNYRSSWMAQGGYEPVAERLFNEVPVDRFLLEYDAERAGGFEPLRFVPHGAGGTPGPTIVLGLVTTKVPQLEPRDDLLRRIDEAARYVPLEQLALSPQCGFASGSLGNLITIDDERRKLDLVASVARQVWG
jgi:5-methyltetrahydropteroyltriglutamate--homocysteine methyltransferase